MRNLKSLGAACLGLGVVSTWAVAEAPSITMMISAGGQSTALSLTGNQTGITNVYNYFGSTAPDTGDWLAAWNFNASDAGTSDGFDRVFTAGNFLVTNLSTSSMVFDLVISMPIALTGPGLFGGSVSAGVTTQDAGSFASLGDTPIWTASSGGLTIASLLRGPISVDRTGAGSSIVGTDSFGQSSETGDSAGFGDDLTVRMQFTLSGGASASFTSVLVGQVPAPGAAALLGLGGLLVNGRRRRA